MSRLFKASLIAPLIFAALVCLGFLIAYWPDVQDTPTDTLTLIALLATGALIMANLQVFILGTPYYHWLKSKNAVTRRNILAGGTVLSALVGLAISLHQHSDIPMLVASQTAVHAAFGLFIAAIIWRLGLKPDAD